MLEDVHLAHGTGAVFEQPGVYAVFVKLVTGKLFIENMMTFDNGSVIKCV